MAGEQDVLPGGQVLTFLPAIGTNKRNPSFWGDRQVRSLVVGTHRQMMLEEARDAIRAVVGADRTPSKSALQRCWARIDKAIAQSRVRPVRSARA